VISKEALSVWSLCSFVKMMTLAFLIFFACLAIKDAAARACVLRVFKTKVLF
jgi:hypothetical protein